MKKSYLAFIVLLSQFLFSQNLPNDCENYIQACGNQSISYNVSGAGVQEIVPQSCSSNEHNSLWLRVTIEQGGTLGFTLKPQSTSINEDYDFWVFGPAADCNSKGSPIRCSTTNPSAANQSNNWTGLNAASTDTTEGPGASGDSFVQQLTVTAGQSYFIVIDRPIGNSPFDLEWSGTATLFNPFTSVTFPDFQNVDLCDVALDNSEPFDFSTLTADYINGLPDYTVQYYTSEINAVTKTNELIGTVNVANGTYYARVEHTNSNCFEIKPIAIVFGDLIANEVNISRCETDFNTGIQVNLNDYNALAYANTMGTTYTFYTNLIDANVENNPVLNPSNITLLAGIHTYYVRVAQDVCFDVVPINITINGLPNTNSSIDLVQCDDDTDGFTAFNLNQATSLFLNVNNGETIVFYEDDLLTTPISNSVAYENTSVNNQTIYAEVTTVNNCSSLVTIKLVVATTQIPASYEEVLRLCDDNSSGANTDEIATFDIESLTPTFLSLFTSGQQLTLSYYENYNDALAEQNAIANTNAYSNTSNPQYVYVRVESATSNTCLGIGPHVKLEVEALPIAPELIYRNCEQTVAGTAFFDTSTIEAELTQNTSAVTITYFDQNNNPLPSPLPLNFETATQNITAQLTNVGGQMCDYVTTISFVVDAQPVINAVPSNMLIACDDEDIPADQDGYYPFNTTNLEAAILGTQTNMQITYADGLYNPLPSPLPNPFYSNTQNIYITVTNLNNPACTASGVLPFEVLELPYISLYEEKIICNEVPNFSVAIDAGLGIPSTQNQFTYLWYKDGTLLVGENDYSLNATQAGEYSVEVYTGSLCFRTRNINLIASNKPEAITVNTIEQGDTNTLEVIVTGYGSYEYSLDGLEFQDSPIFTNVAAGEYTIRVQDKNGCGLINEKISVFGIPLYFTPNNDGYNDTWNIKGYSNHALPVITIFIFDKMGKFIKEINSASEGWDGKRLGVDLPSDDYWFVINLPNRIQKKGYFSLKR